MVAIAPRMATATFVRRRTQEGNRADAVFLSVQSFLCSSSTPGCLRAWQFPLHFLVSDSAYPRCLLCPLPHRFVGQSQL